MKGIRKTFGGTVALDGVDLSVGTGEVHALVGENGAGKSTLMKVLSGAIPADDGVMEIEGQPYRPRNAHDARRAGVAMIYQELSLANHLSVQDNIMLGVEPTSRGFILRKKARQLTMEALSQLGHEELSPDATVASLSVAAKQIVEIARALATGCRVMVLDEPTSSLSVHDTERLFTVLQRLKEQGHAIIYISHFIEEVKRVADTFTVLRDGRIAGDGATNLHSVEDIVALMIGRRIEQLYPRSQRAPGETLLDVRALAGIAKPRSASLTLRRGEILGIAGLVGAGRTELLRALFGLDAVRSGEVKLGIYSGPASPQKRWDQGAGLLSEDRAGEGLAVSLSVADNIIMNPRREAGPLGFLRRAHLDALSDQWIRNLGIRCRGPRQKVRDLSGGNQQKVALSRLLHQDVDVLLLDEPTKGIDVGSKSQIYELMNQLATGDRSSGRQAKGILMVSSYLPELLGMCDRIAVMHRGVLGVPRPAREWDAQTLMLESMGQGAPA
jgi:ribose transport system ATP-binding protein